MDRPIRRTLIATCLAAGLGLAFAASAQQAVAVDAQADAQVVPANAQANTRVDAQAAAEDQAVAKNCLRDTGTRIRTRDPKTGKLVCQGPGRNYSRDDIGRTGQTDLADALRHLDPSVR